MKTKFNYLSVIALMAMAFSFLLVSCEKEELGPPGRGGKKASAESVILSTDYVCGQVEVTLYAGQHIDVGTVTADIDGTDLRVTYNTEGGWYLTELHLAVAKYENGQSVNDVFLPLKWVNRPGNPIPGRFPYKKYFNAEEEVTDFSFVIPIAEIAGNGDKFYIAAHAVVAKAKTGGEADLEAFNDKFPVDLEGVKIKFPGSSTYFGPVTIENSGTFLDGEYNGWCVETGILYQPAGDPTAISSYGLDNYDKVNWLLNHVSASEGGFTKGEIQWAIWRLLNQPEPSLTVYLEPFNPDNIDELVTRAEEEGAGFKPGCGQVIAVLLKYDIVNGRGQDVIIEYPLVCYEDETAWGFGPRFVARGNWATYFSLISCD